MTGGVRSGVGVGESESAAGLSPSDMFGTTKKAFQPRYFDQNVVFSFVFHLFYPTIFC